MKDILDDEISRVQARTARVFGADILDPDDVYTDDTCECGATGTHDCDPATVRMDGDEMHPLEAEVMP